MDVAGVALAVVVLRHEGEGLALLQRDGLGAVLVDDVVVAGGQRVPVAEGDLLLAEVALALGGLHVHAGAGHAGADALQQRLDQGAAEHRVVAVVVDRGLHVAVALAPGVLVGVVEDDELQLGAGVGGPAALGQPGQLLLQDLARALGDRLAVVVQDVGQDQRGARLPGDVAQGAQVRLEDEVAVAGLPAGGLVAVHGVHVDVHAQQVAARLGLVRGDLVEEELRGQPFALQAALHVGHGELDGVDAADRDQVAELLESEHAGTRGHSVPT